MPRYVVQWAYSSSLWPEPLTAGQELRLTAEQADMLNRDSPGVVEPFVEPVVETRAEDEPPRTTARRGPARKR